VGGKRGTGGAIKVCLSGNEKLTKKGEARIDPKGFGEGGSGGPGGV